MYIIQGGLQKLLLTTKESPEVFFLDHPVQKITHPGLHNNTKNINKKYNKTKIIKL